MNKLTKDQIECIKAALKEIGILYVDILHEITDHVATVLEKMDGDFDINLKLYIGRHKKELRRFNRKYIFISWVQSWKRLCVNIITIRFVAFFGLVYQILSGLNMIMEREPFVTLMFFVFCAANGLVSSPEVYRIIKKRAQYSAGEGLSIINVFVFFPGLFSIHYMKEIQSDTFVLLYFTVLLSVCGIMAKTLRNFKLNYKLRYNG